MDNDAAPAPAPNPLTSVDRALLLAARTFVSDSHTSLWKAFPAGRRASLRWAWDHDPKFSAAAARDTLASEHAAQARPDLARIHVSWWIRALHGESASVRRSVVAHLPAGVAGALRAPLDLSEQDTTPDRLPHPAALRAALTFWSVRLIGDLPERSDDPPVIAAISRLDGRSIARLIQTTGLAKWSLTSQPTPALETADQPRLDYFRKTLADTDPRFVQVAIREIEALPVDESRPLSRAGMTCFARLLAAADPYRVRWALQHLPYPSARTLRNLMAPVGRKSPMLVRWESALLQTAWARLHEEGRISSAWEGQP